MNIRLCTVQLNHVISKSNEPMILLQDIPVLELSRKILAGRFHQWTKCLLPVIYKKKILSAWDNKVHLYIKNEFNRHKYHLWIYFQYDRTFFSYIWHKSVGTCIHESPFPFILPLSVAFLAKLEQNCSPRHCMVLWIVNSQHVYQILLTLQNLDSLTNSNQIYKYAIYGKYLSWVP